MKKTSIILFALIAILSFSRSSLAVTASFDKYGGWEGLKGKKTGFFHTEKIDDRWWIVTPEGNVFWSLGMYCVRISGIPETGTSRRAYKDACIKKYGSEGEWARIAKIRLKDWGFNTIGDWSSISTYQEGLGRKNAMAYVIGIDKNKKAPNVFPEGHWGYFPDVFDESFRQGVVEQIKSALSARPFAVNDPWLLGYFVSDEPAWYGSKVREGSLVEDFIRLDSDRPGKKAWVEFIKSKYLNIGDLNKAWGTNYKNFDELLNIKRIKDAEAAKKDKSDFLSVIAEEFSRILYESLRQFDKNHMILGSRPSRDYPEVLKAIGKYTDIFGTHHVSPGYEVSPKFYEVIDNTYKYTEKPILFTVLISGQDAGLPYGMVKTQKDRGIAYWRYLAKVAQDPRVVAVHWFQYFDPPEKCYDAKAANWGVVNDKDEPYEEAVSLIAQANKMVYAYALGLSDFIPEFNETIGVKKDIPQEVSEEGAKMIELPISNAGFEEGRAHWKLQTWKGKSKASIDSTGGHSGKMSLKIKGGDGEGWESVGVAIHSNPQFTLRPGYRYKLSAWIKTEDVESSAFVRIKATDKGGASAYFATEGIYGTEDWKYTETTFVPTGENTVDYLGVQLVGRGTAWCDDIQLEVTSLSGESVKDFTKAETQEKAAPKSDKKVISSIPLSNAGFEDGEKGWKFQTWKGRPTVAIDKNVAHSGKRCVKITGAGDGWDSVGVAVKGDTSFTLDPGTEYRLSGQIKTDGVENKAMVKIKVTYKDGKTGYFETDFLGGTNDWQEVAVDFSPKSENTLGYLACQLIGNGIAWFDDIKLEKLSGKAQ